MKYIALTIGPIYKTLQNAKKPKELWSSSYVFSYVMRNIIVEFKSRKFVTPYIKDESIFDENSDVGLFHDRFIFESIENDIYKLKSVIESVIKQLSKELKIDEKILQEYLQINFNEYSIDDNENPLIALSPYLDTQELFFQISQDVKGSFIHALQNKDNFLLDNKNIVDDLKKLAYKNYYCVVHADGDNMRKVIAKKENIENVSKYLFEYCKVSHEMIKRFGGQTIFAGGDDLLFFAPMINKSENRTIFNLCDEISQDFEKRFNAQATLSFGVSINYIKFPLYEAIENSRNLLFNEAKSDKKNAIAFNITKHSGQSFKSIVSKNNNTVYQHFLHLSSNIKNGTGVDNFLHSLHHKIDTHKTTINQIAKSKHKLENFFVNYFNKDEHKEYGEFFNQLADFIYEVFNDSSIEDKDKLNIIYSTLRFVKFVKGDKQ